MEPEGYTEVQLRNIRISCPTCQPIAGGTKACVCQVFCGDTLCQHHPDFFVDDYVPPAVPSFR